MSPNSKARRERMLIAEKEREQSQRELESRRQRRERGSEGGEEVQPSPSRSPPPLAEPPRRKERRGRGRDVPAEAEVHVISENEDEAPRDAPEEEEKRPSKSPPEENKEEQKQDSDSDDSSDSSDSSSDSDDSSSDSSDSDDEDDKKKEGSEKARSSSEERPGGGRFDDVSPDEDREDSPEAEEEEEVEERSPSLSPRSRLEASLPPYFPAISGCRTVDSFECLNRIAEGTYGVVYRAREKANDRIVALKRLKMEKEKEGFPITSLREINTLLKGQHENIVTVREIVVGSNMDKIYIVMDYVEHDLKALMETMSKKNVSFSIGEVKTLMIQLLSAVHHLHDNWILHRDLKTSNLLLSHKGVLKVGDFGLAREYGSPLKHYTPIVVTLWYRAPELLLGAKRYSTAVDVWSVGCIFGELIGMEPMFPGRSEVDQLNRIFKDLGTPSDAIWPDYSSLPVVKRTPFTEYSYNNLRSRYKDRLSDTGMNLLNQLLTYDPSRRISCQRALTHAYLTSEQPLAVHPTLFPTWPARSERPAPDPAPAPPKPPSGGRDFKELGDDSSVGFTLSAAQAGGGFQMR